MSHMAGSIGTPQICALPKHSDVEPVKLSSPVQIARGHRGTGWLHCLFHRMAQSSAHRACLGECALSVSECGLGTVPPGLPSLRHAICTLVSIVSLMALLGQASLDD